MIVIIGSNGQLGRSIFDACTEQDVDCVQFAGKKFLDITDRWKTVDTISAYDSRDTVFVNCAAVHDPKDVAGCMEVNAMGTLNIVDGIEAGKIIQISTDYVFGGDKEGSPYSSVRYPHPLLGDSYGESKLLSEKIAINKGYVVRVSSLFGKYRCVGKDRNNIVKTIAESAKQGNDFNAYVNTRISLSYAKYVADFVVSLAIGYCPKRTIHHAVCAGCLSHHDLASFVYEAVESKGVVIEGTKQEGPIKTAMTPTVVMGRWENAVEDYLKEEEYI